MVGGGSFVNKWWHLYRCLQRKFSLFCVNEWPKFWFLETKSVRDTLGVRNENMRCRLGEREIVSHNGSVCVLTSKAKYMGCIPGQRTEKLNEYFSFATNVPVMNTIVYLWPARNTITQTVLVNLCDFILYLNELLRKKLWIVLIVAVMLT